ncbi:MAG: NAD(P)-dependent oxidoreductase [Spirochaetes bacterium]|nr:NAD(P)-dependent oxidoreductase [Spirochaetota bacterium]
MPCCWRGTVAERKGRTLIDYGASVTLVSPELTIGLEKLSRIRTKIIKESGNDAELKNKKIGQLLKQEAEKILRKIEKK